VLCICQINGDLRLPTLYLQLQGLDDPRMNGLVHDVPVRIPPGPAPELSQPPSDICLSLIMFRSPFKSLGRAFSSWVRRCEKEKTKSW
jgi:hypothetical protein